MDAHAVIGIAAVVVELVLIGIALYWRAKENLVEVVSVFIALAEQTGKPGREKMAHVVENLYECVPPFLRGILTKDKLEEIAQEIFDWTRRYALEYLAQKQAGKSGESSIREYEAPDSGEIDDGK